VGNVEGGGILGAHDGKVETERILVVAGGDDGWGWWEIEGADVGDEGVVDFEATVDEEEVAILGNIELRTGGFCRSGGVGAGGWGTGGGELLGWVEGREWVGLVPSVIRWRGVDEATFDGFGKGGGSSEHGESFWGGCKGSYSTRT